MKKWYQWFYLSFVFAIGGVINYLDGRQIIAAIIQVSITVVFGLIQFLCDRTGEKGKTIYKYITITTIILLVIWMIYLVLSILR